MGRVLHAVWVLVVCLVSVGCPASGKADTAFESAVELVDDGALHEAKDAFDQIRKKWPKTRAAQRAAEEIEWIDALLTADARAPRSFARDSVYLVARAAEQYQMQKGYYPASLASLVPRYIDADARDPWGRPVLYQRTANGYQVICYGEDGIPGGSGDAADLFVENGALVSP